MAKTKKKSTEGQTTAQQLGTLVKSARDIMRKDKGLNGDLDRLPMLTWIMFLKFLDDMEQLREVNAGLKGEKFRPAIEAPYRWRDWAAKDDGITGDELIRFVNQEEATLPNGTKGPGLFAYLRGLQSTKGGDRRDVVATVFKGTVNRMINGYLLRDVINKIDGIHFNSSDEIHTLGRLYESMLKEMRDAAGDSGEFYTPRAVVRFMVTVVNPQLGEVVLDPACGTGGFLTEAYAHLEKQCRTVKERETLQTASIIGGEAKSLPYLLAQMNLLLHGMDYPRISPGNSLDVKLSELGDRDRVDVVLTNPPFGGEEERGIQNNFPADKQTSETALLFLQLIMRKLRRQPKPGRAAVVVPNGTLFADGVCGRIKQELLTEFNLHTIVRLPNGVFAPYTAIPTNLLFFDRGPTSDVWYYDQPLPEGRKNYTKTTPMQFEEFADCVTWWTNRIESDRAWKVPVATILANGCNLDAKNPRAKQDLDHLPPETLVKRILENIELLAVCVNDTLQQASEFSTTIRTTAKKNAKPVTKKGIPLGELIELRGGGTPSKSNPDFWEGPIPWISPKDMKRREIFDAIDHISVDATNHSPAKLLPVGSVLIVVRGMILAHTVPTAILRAPAAINQDMKALVPTDRVTPEYLCAIFWAFNRQLLALVDRSTHDTRKLLTEKLLAFEITVPSLDEQQATVARLRRFDEKVSDLKRLRNDSSAALDALLPSILDRAFKAEL